jgi:ATP-dependent Lon protease
MINYDWLSNVAGEIDPNHIKKLIGEIENNSQAPISEDGIITLPVLPLRDLILFPRMLVPLPVGRPVTLAAVKQAQKSNHFMLAIPQEDATEEKVSIANLLSVGVLIAISDTFSTDVESNVVLVQSRDRVEILEYFEKDNAYYAKGKIFSEPIVADDYQEAQKRILNKLIQDYTEINSTVPFDAIQYLQRIEEPGIYADMIANAFPIYFNDRQQILISLDISERLNLVTRYLEKELSILTIENEIRLKTNYQVEQSERDDFLKEQIRTMQKELGEEDPWTTELRELRSQINMAKLSKEAKKAAMKEFDRLTQMPPMSPEVGVIRTYIDWLIELPWEKKTKDNLDVTRAKDILNSQHYGLDQVKDRILEFIAVKSLKPKNNKQPILCFIGPPGTGKTSICKSIAKSLGREFLRLSLGGVRDEAEMRGHRRTYIGALPGRILQTIKRGGTINPLFVLDEVDKIGVGFRGDPAAALLEVLDPEQNYEFSDHYLEIPYDLSQVLFITTANDKEDIPWALLDRMEIIEFPGYIQEEKIEIAKQFIVEKQLENSGLEPNELQFTEPVIGNIIKQYTYEAGVRNLEREIGKVCRKIARLKAEGKKFPTRINTKALEKYLGPPQMNRTIAEEENEVGVVTGLAWTPGGGEIMPIEVLILEGKGNLQITGHIGDIMQESMQAALSYLKSRAKLFDLDPEEFENIDVHVHVPEGGVPKDGPSAGIAIATAIISAFTNQKVDKEIGMTGEITLRGRVLPVGGVRDKILAAHRAGLKKVIIPKKNEKNLVDIPKKAKADLEIIAVQHMDEVLALALLPKAKKQVSRKIATPKDNATNLQPGAAN